MRNIIMVACAAVLGAGCYAQHDSSASIAAASAREDAGSSCIADGGLSEEEAIPPSGCIAQCDACAGPWDVDYEDCLDGCTLRAAVAARNGCADDFPAWADCFAPNDCDYRACLALRTCW